jgi:hypothetical protein
MKAAYPQIGVPIKDPKRLRAVKAAASSAGMTAAAWGRKLMFDMLDGKLVHIDVETPRAPKAQRRVE